MGGRALRSGHPVLVISPTCQLHHCDEGKRIKLNMIYLELASYASYIRTGSRSLEPIWAMMSLDLETDLIGRPAAFWCVFDITGSGL